MKLSFPAILFSFVLGVFVIQSSILSFNFSEKTSDKYHLLRHKLYKNAGSLCVLEEVQQDKELCILLIERHMRQLKKKIARTNKLAGIFGGSISLYGLLSGFGLIGINELNNESMVCLLESVTCGLGAINVLFLSHEYKRHYELKLRQDELILKELNQEKTFL